MKCAELYREVSKVFGIRTDKNPLAALMMMKNYLIVQYEAKDKNRQIV